MGVLRDQNETYFLMIPDLRQIYRKGAQVYSLMLEQKKKEEKTKSINGFYQEERSNGSEEEGFMGDFNPRYSSLYCSQDFQDGFFIGVQLRIWRMTWNAIVPTKLTIFGWRLCQAILREVLANGVHWLEFAVQEISNEDLEWLLTILWALWSVRNTNFVPEKDRNEKGNPVFDHERDHQEPISKPPPTVPPAVRSRWVPPPTGLCKVNFDGAFDADGQKGGIGVIIRDNEGFVWGGATVKIDRVTEASVSEAMAAVKALAVARDMGCPRIILESDCVGILSNLSMKDIDEGSQLRSIVDEGKKVMGEFKECYVHPIEKQGNGVANLLARHCVVSEGDLYWKHDYPSYIHDAVMYDAINL